MGKYCFGIDVGGTSVKCGLFQTVGVLVEKWEIPTRKENSGEAILPDIAKTILDKIAERKLDKEEIDGVGIGVPGPVNERGEERCSCSSIECLSIVNGTNQAFFKHTSQDASSTTDSKASNFTAFAKFFTDEFRYSQWSTTSAQLEYEAIFNDASLVKEFTS